MLDTGALVARPHQGHARQLERLVSRRWLEWGPWRLIRDEASELSFVQFQRPGGRRGDRAGAGQTWPQAHGHRR